MIFVTIMSKLIYCLSIIVLIVLIKDYSCSNDGEKERDNFDIMVNLIKRVVAEELSQFDKEMERKLLRLENKYQQVEIRIANLENEYLKHDREEVKTVKKLVTHLRSDTDSIINTTLAHHTLLEKVFAKVDKQGEQLVDLDNSVKVTKDELKRSSSKFENTLIGVEGAFTATFEVGGNHNYYYPVAIGVHRQWINRSPLKYEIYRSYWEKGPEQLRPANDDEHNKHYPALSFKFLANEGGWMAAGSTTKVIYHQWRYRNCVAKIESGQRQDYRVIVWLRGGGMLYHIKSPIDLSGNYSDADYEMDSIKVYYLDNDLIHPAHDKHAGINVSPLPVGYEDSNLVKPGHYDGWAF